MFLCSSRLVEALCSVGSEAVLDDSGVVVRLNIFENRETSYSQGGGAAELCWLPEPKARQAVSQREHVGFFASQRNLRLRHARQACERRKESGALPLPVVSRSLSGSSCCFVSSSPIEAFS